MAKEYKIEVKIKNNLLYSAIVEAGYASLKKFAAAHGIPYASLCHLISMRNPAIHSKTGKITKTTERICKILNKMPSEIFTDYQANCSLKSNKFEADVGENEISAYLAMRQASGLLEYVMENEGDREIMDSDLKKSLSDVLDDLTPREEKVLRMRFGIDTETNYTLDEIAEKYGVTRERIRQIEHRALMKLRHPKRAFKLKDFIK